jgi:hypothetical protein
MGFRGLIKEKGGGWGVTDRLIHVKQNIWMNSTDIEFTV